MQAFIFQRLWELASIATTVWFKDVMMYIESILALLFIIIMASVIYLFDIYVFNSRTIRYEDGKKLKALEKRNNDAN